MKFEECIPALRLGKKIKRPGWGEFCHLHANDNFKIGEWLEYDDFEIVENPKQKVKYYPALVYDSFNKPYISNLLYKNEEQAMIYFGCNFIRLIKEVPEAVEEKEE